VDGVLLGASEICVQSLLIELYFFWKLVHAASVLVVFAKAEASVFPSGAGDANVNESALPHMAAAKEIAINFFFVLVFIPHYSLLSTPPLYQSLS
jgi:hypothetical protein